MSSDALPPLSPRPIATSEFSHRRSFGVGLRAGQVEPRPGFEAPPATESIDTPPTVQLLTPKRELSRPPPIDVSGAHIRSPYGRARSIAGALFPHLDGSSAATAVPSLSVFDPTVALTNVDGPRPSDVTAAPPPPAASLAGIRQAAPQGSATVHRRDMGVQAHDLTDGSELPQPPKWGGPVQTCCAPGYRGDIGCYWCCYCTDVTCCARPECSNCGVGFVGCFDTAADSAFGAPWDASQGRAVLSVGWGGTRIVTGSVWRSHLRSFLFIISSALVILLSGAAHASAWRVWRRVDGALSWNGSSNTTHNVTATPSAGFMATAATWSTSSAVPTATYLTTATATDPAAADGSLDEATSNSTTSSGTQWAPLLPRESALIDALLFFVSCGGVIFVGVVAPLLVGSAAHGFPVWAHSGIFSTACGVFLVTTGVPLSVVQICLCMRMLSDVDPFGFLVLGASNNIAPEMALVRTALIVTCVTTGGWAWFLYMLWASEWLHRQVAMRVRAMRDTWRAREVALRVAERRQRLVASVIAFAQVAPQSVDSWSAHAHDAGTGMTPLVNRH